MHFFKHYYALGHAARAVLFASFAALTAAIRVSCAVLTIALYASRADFAAEAYVSRALFADEVWVSLAVLIAAARAVLSVSAFAAVRAASRVDLALARAASRVVFADERAESRACLAVVMAVVYELLAFDIALSFVVRALAMHCARALLIVGVVVADWANTGNAVASIENTMNPLTEAAILFFIVYIILFLNNIRIAHPYSRNDAYFNAFLLPDKLGFEHRLNST